MKTILIIFLLAASLVNAQSSVPKSENADGTSMMPIFNQAERLIELLEEKNNLEIIKMEFDIISSSKKTTWRTLHKDVTYSISVFGDYRVKDVDVTIYKSVNDKWVEVVKDKKEESYALVAVKPEKTQLYKIEISVYQFKEDYKAAHYGLFFVR